jgi:hypothetical protein
MINSQPALEQFLGNYPVLVPVMGVLFALLMIWSLVWKGLALWKSAQRSEKWWFIAMLLINTVGILEILYIYVFSKREEKMGKQ